ncbi:MAG: adenosylmethionine--8-amino-7-oxononanoate transaminase [Baekduia sp.]
MWDELLDIDRRHVWHPYASMPAAEAPLPVASASGVRITLADGRELIDGMASWWCAIHGYRHATLDAAVTDQLARMAHVMFGGLTHEPAIRLAEQLVALTPRGLDYVFFADSGSVSVEVAIKMALQYWRAQGRPRRHRLLTVRGGYHGDTFAAMSVTDPVGGMHALFADVLPKQLFAPRPPAGFDAPPDPEWQDAVTALAEQHAGQMAAIVLEPVVQGAGGMHFYAPSCVRFLRELADAHGILLIADEIATGFGRTGALFACDHADVSPDIMCVGKALTGGYMTLAATLCNAAVAETITTHTGALMHGPTFMANPLACAVAGASLQLLEEMDWSANIIRIQNLLSAALAPARDLKGVRDVRVLGAIGVIQLERDVDIPAAARAAIDAGVWLRPFRDLIYTMPPYITSDADIETIGAAMTATAAASCR